MVKTSAPVKKISRTSRNFNFQMYDVHLKVYILYLFPYYIITNAKNRSNVLKSFILQYIYAHLADLHNKLGFERNNRGKDLERVLSSFKIFTLALFVDFLSTLEFLLVCSMSGRIEKSC